MKTLIASLVLALLTSATAQNTMPLAGTWRFALDRADVGTAERWFARELEQRIQLPGALQNQGFGDDITVDTKWTGEVGTDRWKQRPEYAKYRQPGNIKVPFFLQPEKHYVGAAWYQRDIEIPAGWQGKRVVLTLERPHWETRVWIDDRLVGTNDSLCTPHVYDLGASLTPGKHKLTIRVDNRVIVGVGDWSHSVSDHTQGNWNGLVGRIELSATSPVWIEEVQVYPNAAKRSVLVKGKLGNATGQAGAGKVTLVARPVDLNEKNSARRSLDVSWTAEGGAFTTEVTLGPKFSLWDEFTPTTCRLAVSLDQQDAKDVHFGLRNITTANRQFLINGRPTFFRGTLECCIFPLTGHPPTDVDSWKRIIRICKEHGLNSIRFHSWCPPEGAFTAADQLGFYYQVECGVWTQPGSGQPIDDWIYRESERIVRAYGNHPSFVLLTHGNEPHGPKHAEFLARWVNHWKAKDARRLYTSGSAYPQLPENQYHVHHTGRGPSGWLGKDYRNQYDRFNVPIIIHEMGQWCVYPNFDEITKYTGPLKPKNFEIFRDSLAEHGMLDQRKDFVFASGKLQALCYKEECEAAMRTPGVGGVQLLDLHDFPGQGTALVGVLDPFWDSKGYISADEFRRFYNSTVPLARLLKRTWTTDETLTCDVEIAHFGAAPIENDTATWRLVDNGGSEVASGEFAKKTIPLGSGTLLGKVSVDLSKLAAPKAYRLVVTVGTRSTASPSDSRDAVQRVPTRFENNWPLWLYPAKSVEASSADVLVTTALDEAAQARLDSGGKVFLASSKLSSMHPRLTFEPIFWNRYMFNTQGRQTLGLLCAAQHPALAQFPTDAWQDWQWQDIVTQAGGVILDDLPKNLRPIVQVIDDWNTNRKLGLVFECRVGRGKLLFCSADLASDLEERPAARQLRASLLAYAASDRFDPPVEITKDDLQRVLHRAAKSTLVNLGAKVLRVDSEDREHGNTAAKAIDGDPDTFWHTRWQPRNDPLPHELVVDLGREITLKGITYLPRQEQSNGRIAQCEISASRDAQSWPAPVAKPSWRNTTELQTVTFASAVKARYLRIRVTAEVKQQPFAAIGELDVITGDK